MEINGHFVKQYSSCLKASLKLIIDIFQNPSGNFSCSYPSLITYYVFFSVFRPLSPLYNLLTFSLGTTVSNQKSFKMKLSQLQKGYQQFSPLVDFKSALNYLDSSKEVKLTEQEILIQRLFDSLFENFSQIEISSQDIPGLTNLFNLFNLQFDNNQLQEFEVIIDTQNLSKIYDLEQEIDGLVQHLVWEGKTKSTIQSAIDIFKTFEFGSLNILRALTQIQTISTRLNLKVNSWTGLDVMVVSSRTGLTEEQIQKRQKQLSSMLEREYDFRIDRSSQNHKEGVELDDMTIGDTTQDTEVGLGDSNSVQEGDDFDSDYCEKVIIFCQPNAGYYELSGFQSTLIQFYLEHNVTVVLWNYRGYGYSDGYATLSNIESDAKFLASFIKKRLRPKMLAVHGVSLGGHAAKSMANHVDIVIIDRTFSHISYIPIEIFAPLIQRGYNLFIDDYNSYVPSLVHSDSQKIMIFDPNVKFSSFFYTKIIIFNFKNRTRSLQYSLLYSPPPQSTSGNYWNR